MTWDGNGTYSRTNGTNTGATLWNADAAAGTKITTARHDTHDEDIATAITACLTKNMETKPTADFVPNVTTTYDLGTTSLKWEDLHLNGNALIGGTLGTTGAATFSSTVTVDSAEVHPPTLATEQASTSGTEIDFTSIPAWVKKITIMFVGVSTSGTDAPYIQLGDSGGFETSGYLGSGGYIDASTAATSNYTAAFGIKGGSGASIYHGSITLSLESAAAFTWSAFGAIGASTAGAIYFTTGTKSLSSALTQVRITTSGGSDTFDAGVINALYE